MSKEMTKLETSCEHCGKTYKLAPEKEGKSVTCKKCGEKFKVVFSTPSSSTSDGVSEQDLETFRNLDNYKPDELMYSVSKSRMTMTFLLSLVVHLIFIALLSVPFISNCIKYNTLDPSTVIAEINKKKEEEAKKLDKEKKKAERLKKLQEEAELKQKAETKENKNKQEGGKKLSKIEESLQETSDERPESSSLDGIDDEL